MKKPGAVVVLIFTTIAVVIWVGYEIYESFRKESVLDIPEKTLETIDPSLDTDLLGSLPQKLFFEEGEVPEPVPTQESQPETEEPEEATDSAALELEEAPEGEAQPESE